MNHQPEDVGTQFNSADRTSTPQSVLPPRRSPKGHRTPSYLQDYACIGSSVIEQAKCFSTLTNLGIQSNTTLTA